MNPSIRHEIDDTDQVRPHVRLCHQMLRAALSVGFSAVELTTPSAGPPTARAQTDGAWKPFLAFPPAVYRMLVEHLKAMAGVAPDRPQATGTILVRSAGRDASIKLSAQRAPGGIDALILHFPGQSVGEAAT